MQKMFNNNIFKWHKIYFFKQMSKTNKYSDGKTAHQNETTSLQRQ